MKFASRIVGDGSAAEDIIQDVFTDLWINRKNVDISKSIKPYLYKVAYNRSIDFLKLSENKNIPFSNHTTVLEDLLYSTFTSHDELNMIEFENEITKIIDGLPV